MPVCDRQAGGENKDHAEVAPALFTPPAHSFASSKGCLFSPSPCPLPLVEGILPGVAPLGLVVFCDRQPGADAPGYLMSLLRSFSFFRVFVRFAVSSLCPGIGNTDLALVLFACVGVDSRLLRLADALGLMLCFLDLVVFSLSLPSPAGRGCFGECRPVGACAFLSLESRG